MNTVMGTYRKEMQADVPGPWPPRRDSPSALYSRPFAVADRLLEQIGQKRAAELEEVRADLATEAGGRWAVLFLPFRAYTGSSPSWAGTWVAVRGRRGDAETVEADNPLILRSLIAEGWWWRHHRSAA